MSMLAGPLLSAYDPVDSLEGTIDPLRTQAIYESLAESVLPFVTARMRRPRFVTAIAVGAWVRRGIAEESQDGRVPAWIAFEWLLVEAVARARGDGVTDVGRTGIPGLTKVRSALRKGHEVGSATYLKTPKIFGFTGIYRRLGLGLNVLDAELDIDEGGIDLLNAWEQSSGLSGFVSGDGEGKRFYERLKKAVASSLEAGHTRSFGDWDELSRVLEPAKCTKREADVLVGRLLDARLGSPEGDPEASAMRRELVLAIEAYGSVVEREEERQFLTSLECGAELRRRLDRILAFEAACRIVEDALHLILHLSTAKGHAYVRPSDFPASEAARALLRRLPAAMETVAAQFAGHALEGRVTATFDRYREIRDASDLFTTVVGHHEEAQHDKPPEPKRPWFVKREPGPAVAARMGFARSKPPPLATDFVHEYRLPSVSSFLRDFGRL